jgi:predicted helicase
MPKIYLENIFNTAKAGGTREESYYPDLKNFLEDYSKKIKKKFLITPLPKKTEAGNPDFRILTAKKELVGYIEAKSPDIENLDEIEDSEQLQRYRHTFPNLILTNFFEFRRYRNGEFVEKVQIGRPFIAYQLKQVPPIENEKEFFKLLDQFFSFRTQRTTTAKALATELAKRTRFLRDNVIIEELKEEKIEGTQMLEGFYKAFKDHLISSLSIEEFADLFSQTITYGLFAARARADKKFHRELAYKYIPHTIGILRNVFKFVSSAEIPKPMEWIVDDISEVLSATDVKTIISNFYKEGKGKDPIIHFYETFLAEYDPKEREKRGVYYTPEPVVSYIVRSIHKLLKDKFGKTDGFAAQSVTVLDPAAGTLTFPAYAIDLAISEFKEKYGDGGINSLIKDHILKDFYAFELMMAPYAIGHLKIGLILDNLGYQLSDEERFNLYLTNTLDFSKEDPNQFPGVFEQSIAKESSEALKVKEDVPVMVVMGNPPYSVSSSNIIDAGTDFFKLYESYKEIVRKEERNIQPLSDDYIKFIAFAHWKIKQAGQGIVGMITNNSYLDGLIHRDLRRKLLEDFDEIYILNLHGNSKRQETALDGGKDENVFDIQQGVSIILAIKKDGLQKVVKYADLRGSRGDIDEVETKYGYLHDKDVIETKWQLLKPSKPSYFLYPKVSSDKNYENFVSIRSIFQNFNAGIVSGKDEVSTSFDYQSLKNKMSAIFIEKNAEILEQSYELDNSAGQKIVKNKVNIEFDENKIVNYHYRPLDVRFIYYEPKFLERPRVEIASHMLATNISLSLSRLTVNKVFSNVIVSDELADYKLAESSRGSYIFPLYLHLETKNDSKQKDIFDGQNKKSTKISNINKELLEKLKMYFKHNITYEDIFNYIYAILYSNTYRQKYNEFLKIDFPRIPFTKDYQLFQKLAEFGKKLVDLHLLKASKLNKPIVKFKGAGDNSIDKIEYLALKDNQNVGGCVWINENQHFDGVNEFLWNYHIGGYQVLSKWLKDRKGNTLSAEEIKTYCKIATTIHYTILAQKEIDKLYSQVEKSLIK